MKHRALHTIGAQEDIFVSHHKLHFYKYPKLPFDYTSLEKADKSRYLVQAAKKRMKKKLQGKCNAAVASFLLPAFQALQDGVHI